jgi:hypothetical protein
MAAHQHDLGTKIVVLEPDANVRDATLRLLARYGVDHRVEIRSSEPAPTVSGGHPTDQLHGDCVQDLAAIGVVVLRDLVTYPGAAEGSHHSLLTRLRDRLAPACTVIVDDPIASSDQIADVLPDFELTVLPSYHSDLCIWTRDAT